MSVLDRSFVVRSLLAVLVDTTSSTKRLPLEYHLAVQPKLASSQVENDEFIDEIRCVLLRFRPLSIAEETLTNSLLITSEIRY